MKTFITYLIFVFTAVNYAQVGIGTTEPKSTLDINGNLSVKVVDLNGGPANNATSIEDGVYINLIPTAGSPEFILPDATAVPGRMYILRNITNSADAVIYTFGFIPGAGNGVEFFPGDSSSGRKNITMQAAGANRTKTLIFISDGANWTYGILGF